MNSQTRRMQQQIYLVDKIISKRKRNGVYEYKVKWEGYSFAECTWEPKINLSTVQFLVDEYEKSLKKNNNQFLKKKTAIKAIQTRHSASRKRKGKGKANGKIKPEKQENVGMPIKNKEPIVSVVNLEEEIMNDEKEMKIDKIIQTEAIDVVTINGEERKENTDVTKKVDKDKQENGKERENDNKHKTNIAIKAIKKISLKYGQLIAMCTYEQDGLLKTENFTTMQLKDLASSLLIDFYESKLKFVK